MNFLDWCLVVLVRRLRRLRLLAGLHHRCRSRRSACCSAAWPASGWRRSCSVTPRPSLWVSLGALFVVLMTASLGQAILQYAGVAAARPDHLAADPRRRRRRWRRASAWSRCSSWPGCWAWRSAGRASPGVSPQVRDSRGPGRGQQRDAGQAQRALRSFDHVVGSSFFPRYLEPFAPERIVKVAARRGAGAARSRHPAGRRSRSSSSAAPTAAAAASRAPASSTPRTS